jgi:hypothetical protein
MLGPVLVTDGRVRAAMTSGLRTAPNLAVNLVERGRRDDLRHDCSVAA